MTVLQVYQEMELYMKLLMGIFKDKIQILKKN